MVNVDRYEDDLSAMLRSMTGKQLRQYARDNHVPLGGANTKHDMRVEICAQMRHRMVIQNHREKGGDF